MVHPPIWICWFWISFGLTMDTNLLDLICCRIKTSKPLFAQPDKFEYNPTTLKRVIDAFKFHLAKHRHSISINNFNCLSKRARKKFANWFVRRIDGKSTHRTGSSNLSTSTRKSVCDNSTTVTKRNVAWINRPYDVRHLREWKWRHI